MTIPTYVPDLLHTNKGSRQTPLPDIRYRDDITCVDLGWV